MEVAGDVGIGNTSGIPTKGQGDAGGGGGADALI